ncbi:MAG: type II secretion system protein [Clostridia bacterium]|nr:type II secretion system protein [Clostridia bacterium]
MKNNAKRRGFTVLELSIVLALVAIIGVMTVTFTILISKRAKESKSALEFAEQTASVERTAKLWLDQMQRADATFVVEQNRLSAVVLDKEAFIEIKDGKFTVALLDGTSSSIDAGRFTGLECEIKTNAKNEEFFVFSLLYLKQSGDETSIERYVFVIDTFVGDTILIGGGA